MQEKHLYEYAVIRVLPLVEREEFINVGIILFCKQAKFIKVLFQFDEKRIKSFSQNIDLEQLKANCQAFEKIAHGEKIGSVIAEMDLPSRFRWLTAVRSSVLQTSRPHTGLCKDLEQTVKRLLDDFTG
jgi:hypothetical protein